MSDYIAITIDGPVAAGKTVVGTLVARSLQCRFLDTGAMYRAVTWAALEDGIDLEDEPDLVELANRMDMRLVQVDGGQRLLVDGQDITDHLREPEVERGVSPVAKVPGVRTAMREQQQLIAEDGDIVMAGRDIGTVVLPDAQVKIFLTASVEVRARRRHEEMLHAGRLAEYEQVLSDLKRRDKIDSERDDSPLRPADDSITIDTDRLGIDEIAREIIGHAERN